MNKLLSLALLFTFQLFLLQSVPAADGGAKPPAPPKSKPMKFEFALIGDTPYDDDQETNLFPNLLADLNRAKLAFVVHDGDFKSGASPCSDELFERRLKQFQTSKHPLIYLFGDNEWTDCGRSATHKTDPMERLETLRAMFCVGEESLGRRRIPLTRQNVDPDHAIYRENVLWTMGSVVFLGLNVPGNSNNYGQPEYGPRNAANLAWMKRGFDLARTGGFQALMIVIQANPHFDLGATNSLRRGFNDMINLLEKETIAFAKPVVLVHGDSHYYRIDQPLLGKRSGKRLENFTRVETFGNPDNHWIRVTVNPRDPNFFTYRPEYVRKNFVNHKR